MTTFAHADDHTSEDVRTLASWGEEQLAGWLLAAFDAPSGDPLHIPDQRSLREYVVALVGRIPSSDTETRLRVKRAVKRAIVEWRPPPTNAYGTLSRLAFMAADLGVSGATGQLMIVVERVLRPVPPGTSDRVQADTTLSDTLAVLAGFVMLDDVSQYLERLFWDPTFNPRYSGLLLNALSRRWTLSFPRYLRRFVDVIQARPDACDQELAAWNLATTLSFRTIALQLKILDEDVRHWLLVTVGPLFYRRYDHLDPDTRKIFVEHMTEMVASIVRPATDEQGRVSIDEEGAVSLNEDTKRDDIVAGCRALDDRLSQKDGTKHLTDELRDMLDMAA